MHSLESGNCAVVSLPKFVPTGFRQALRRYAERPRGPREWHCLTGEILPGQSLTSWLWEQWHGETEHSSPPHLTVGKLLEQLFERSGGIWEMPSLDTIPPAEWPKFLDDYQRTLQTIPRLHRNVLVVVVEGSPALSCLLQRNQPQLTFHAYIKQPTRLDMLLFLSQVATVSRVGKTLAVERELVIHSAVALYPTDPESALRFLEQGILAQCSIVEQVKEEQKQRGWIDVGMPIDDVSRWLAGFVGYVDGKAEFHLCTPQEANLEARIRQALWLAQARVLLPWLEYQRWQILHKPELKQFLKQALEKEPYRKEYENGNVVIIGEAERLEPAHILHLLRKKHKPRAVSTSFLASAKLHGQLEILVLCRNDLSHLSPLEADKITWLLDAGW